MDLVAHLGPQCLVYQLVPLHGAQACKARGNHHRLEMDVVLARHRRAAAGQSSLDERGYFKWTHAFSSSCMIRRWTLTTRTKASSSSDVRRSPSRSTVCPRWCPAWGMSLHAPVGFVLTAVGASWSPGWANRATSAARLPRPSPVPAPRPFS